jgi:hypothetical protein
VSEVKRPRWTDLVEFAKSAAAVVGAVLAIAYFVSRLGQTSFYSRFGLEPDDVGLGRVETLTRAAVWLVLIAFVPLALALLASVFNRSIAKWVLTAVLGALLFSLPFWVPHAYKHDANCVEAGKAVRPAGLSTPLRIITNPLGLRAEPVQVQWIDGTSPPYDFGGEKVMYLGRAGGIAVFFDPRTEQTVRAPQNDILIKWKTHGPAEERCG